MLQLSNAGKRFGPKVLFQDLDWLITARDRVGLVGANGTGKTTLLKILAGIEGLDYGAINRQKDAAWGYLPQDGLTLSGRTVFAECLSVFDDIHAMQRETEELARRMAEVEHEGPEYSQIAERFQHIQAEMHARDGYTIEAEVGAVLNGLGFSKDDWGRRTEEFSGGWQMRIALAKLLLQKPNLLLLDEPTNHLDLATREALGMALNEFEGTVMLVSHDRSLLRAVCDEFWLVTKGGVEPFDGDLDDYQQFLRDEARRMREQAAGEQKVIA
jgi:ATP-binding cassette subfamily F protein 3